MSIDFSNIKLEVLDISVNAAPEIYINQHGITFSKRVLEDMGYPQNVAYCTDGNRIFAIRAAKSNEAKSTPFSKSRSEQSSTLSCNNKNLHDSIAIFIPDYDPHKRYKVIGEYDAENRTMYYDMTTAEVSLFREKGCSTGKNCPS